MDGQLTVTVFVPHKSARPEWVTEQTQVWWQEGLDSGWAVAIQLVPDPVGRAIAAEVRILPQTQGSEPGQWSRQSGDVPIGGASSSLLRLPFATIMRRARLALEARHKEDPGSFGDPNVGGVPFGEAGFYSKIAYQSPSRPGRRGMDDYHYLAAALIYVEAINARARGPVQIVAHKLGYSLRYASELVMEARKRNLLTPAPGPGKAGGKLTAKARRLEAKRAKDLLDGPTNRDSENKEDK